MGSPRILNFPTGLPSTGTPSKAGGPCGISRGIYITNGEIPSKWWDRYCHWHFQKIDLPAEEAHLLWEPAKVQVVEALARESRQLQNELYRWKLSNQERIESLKRQVQLYLDHMEEIQRDQKDLF